MAGHAPRALAWTALFLAAWAGGDLLATPAHLALATSPAPAGPAPLRARVSAAVAPGVSITMVSSPRLTLDNTKPCQEGPRAAYATFKITNTSGATLTDLRAAISGFSGGIALGGGQAAGQYVGALAPGASRFVYWYVTYPCTYDVSATLTVSVTDNTAGATTGSGTVTTGKMNKTEAGGKLVGALLGAGAVVGQTIAVDIDYEFGGVNAGDSYNFQPTGNTTFRADCFQLVRTEVTASTATAVPVGTVNQQYFIASTNQTGSKFPVTMRYFFKYLCADTQAPLKPYGNQIGGTQLMYSANYETYIGPTMPGATNPFTITKSASPTKLASGGSTTFTVTISNPSTLTAELDSIVDVLPAGVSYGGIAPGSGVTVANSGSTPASGATGTIVFRGIPGSSYSLPAGGSLALAYTANVTSTPGRYTNTARGYAGLTPIGPASATVTVGSADLTVSKTGPATALTGDSIRYVVTTTNAGPHTAFNVVVTDTLPAGVAFGRATGGATLSGSVVTWPTLSTLASGASRVDTVVVVAPSSAGTVTNLAAATSDTYDPAAANNNGSAAGSRVTTTVSAPSISVSVTPQGLSSPLDRLAGKYSQAFTVNNTSNITESFDLLGRGTGTPLFLSVDSITGTGVTASGRPDSVRVSMTAGLSQAYTVWYTAASGTGADNTLRLKARSVALPATEAEGWVEVRRVLPSVSLSGSVSPNTAPKPGTDLTYTLDFNNAGTAEAHGVVVTDLVPAEITFKIGSITQTLPSGVTTTVAYSTDGGATWAYTPVSGGCGAPTGYDACVQRIRWTFQGNLPADAALSAGTLRYVGRIE